MILDLAATVLLAPVLLAQAVRLRKRALRLPEAAGPRAGTQGTGPDLTLLIVGDSSAAGVGVATQNEALAGQLVKELAASHAVHWTLIAQTGATTPTTLARLENTELPRTDVVVLVLGVNDVTRGGPMGGWLRTHARLRSLLRSQADARRLYVCEIPPLGAFPLLPDPLRWLLGRRAARFDAALRAALSHEDNTAYVLLPDTLDPADMAEDGFHPGPVIYAAWAKEMARRIVSDGPL